MLRFFIYTLLTHSISIKMLYENKKISSNSKTINYENNLAQRLKNLKKLGLLIEDADNIKINPSFEWVYKSLVIFQKLLHSNLSRIEQIVMQIKEKNG